MLNMQEKVARLRLLKTPNIGRVTFFHLLKQFKTAVNAIAGFDDYLAGLSGKRFKSYVIPSESEIKKIFEKSAENNVNIVFYDDPDYPKEFLISSHFSPVLFCKGDLTLFKKNSLAVIGARAASLNGISFTKRLVRDLSLDLCIVSGFAKGIDTAAHEAALAGGTIAVLGCGVNYVYPEENAVLYRKILDNNGLIVSEIGLDEMPKANFLSYRNRVISGVSKGVLVVEAAMNSGSLITAKYALEQGKNIFAVPGHPYDIRAAGTNYLIKNGAILTRSIEDVLAEYSSYIVEKSVQSTLFSVAESDIEEVKKWVLECVSSLEVSISEIVALSSFSVSDLNAALAELELLDEIRITLDMVAKK